MIHAPRPSPRLAHIREAVEHHRDELVLVHAVSEAANESTSLATLLGEVMQMICEYMDWPVGHALGVGPDDPSSGRSFDLWHFADPDAHGLFRATSGTMIHGSALTHLCSSKAPYSLDDLPDNRCLFSRPGDRADFVRREAARHLGLDRYYAIPILCEREVVAVLEFLAGAAVGRAPDSLLTRIATALGRVAERLQHANEQQRLANELRRRNRELEQFAYVASHDLRAPLRGIANLAGWIARDLEPHLTANTRRHLELLEGRVNRMEALISGLLEYSRVGRNAVPDEHIDVGTLVREIVDLLAAGNAVEWRIAALPGVRGPRVLLRQVFHNLLANAVKYSVVPHPRVDIGAERDQAGLWRFSVRDNGPGIAACHQSRIWEIFQTLQPRDDVESTGIGLSLVRKIVEQRGGEVGVESTPGQGACFYFSWPETTPELVPEHTPERASEHAP